MQPIQIICSTNRTNPVSGIISRIYQQVLEEQGAKSEIIYLADLPTNYLETALYENSGKNPDFQSIRDAMLQSEKFVFVVPEYNGSFPGVLKAFIDGLKFPETFTNKKAALLAISSGDQGGALAMSHLADILNYCGTHVLAKRLRFSKIGAAIENEQLVNESYKEQLKKQAAAFVSF